MLPLNLRNLEAPRAAFRLKPEATERVTAPAAAASMSLRVGDVVSAAGAERCSGLQLPRP